MGTELQARGLPLGEAPEWWSLAGWQTRTERLHSASHAVDRPDSLPQRTQRSAEEGEEEHGGKAGLRRMVGPSAVPLTDPLASSPVENVASPAIGVAGLHIPAAPPAVDPTAAVRAVHAAYAELGVDWIRTNTFGGNRVRLAAVGLEGAVEAVNRAAVQLAREAAGGLPVLASVGPTGSCDPREWAGAYREQFDILAAAGVDGAVVETVVRAEEGTAAVQAAVRSGLGFVIASFTPGPDGNLLDGADPVRVAPVWRDAGAAVVGCNCGTGPESLLGPLRRLAAAGIGPLYAAPNAGLPTSGSGERGAGTGAQDAECGGSAAAASAETPQLVSHRLWYPVQPDAFVKGAIQLQELGVRWFAGCCGAGPAHMRALAHALRSTL